MEGNKLLLFQRATRFCGSSGRGGGTCTGTPAAVCELRRKRGWREGRVGDAVVLMFLIVDQQPFGPLLIRIPPRPPRLPTTQQERHPTPIGAPGIGTHPPQKRGTAALGGAVGQQRRSGGEWKLREFERRCMTQKCGSPGQLAGAGGEDDGTVAPGIPRPGYGTRIIGAKGFVCATHGPWLARANGGSPWEKPNTSQTIGLCDRSTPYHPGRARVNRRGVLGLRPAGRGRGT